MSFIVSVLILLVGSGSQSGKTIKHFSIQSLVELVTDLTGSTGIWTFGLGFVAAAFSSMLTVS